MPCGGEYVYLKKLRDLEHLLDHQAELDGFSFGLGLKEGEKWVDLSPMSRSSRLSHPTNMRNAFWLS
jgi:hypothetical protein